MIHLQICDAVNSEKANKGDYIIKQGEKGDKFFILDEGEAYASKVFHEGEKEVIVKEYKSGDYFGELALLRDEPRAASVIAKTKCKLITLDRLAFKRLLGPLEKLLKRNSEMYQKYNMWVNLMFIFFINIFKLYYFYILFLYLLFFEENLFIIYFFSFLSEVLINFGIL